MTPNFAVVHVHTPEWRGLRLCLPLFLLWIPAILLSPIIFLVIFGLCIAGSVSTGRAISVFWAILCSLPGTNVRVSTNEAQILVRIL
jgi:hypothetical protein